MGILEVEGLKRSFGGVTAVDGLSMSVEEESITGLIGPNGSGKSTTFNLISGTLESDGGTVVFDGEEITDEKPYTIARRGLGRTFQQARVFDEMTVYENLLVVQTDDDKDARANELLGLIEMHDERNSFAQDLSGGQQVLLGIARTLMLDPDLLLLDEPFAGVNPGLVADIRQLLVTLVEEEGKTVLIIDHEMDELSKICDEIVVLVDGKKLLKGDPEAVREDEDVQRSYLGGLQ
ncbi:ABC transporter ATP-binding protein [Natrarchaeobius oligotrophus]|uniref:ABC transporter ATP-binding protein n=1 Tax=Natrarchaeobius chitinivorans TaxID=1679083 RepID=A0A3N6MLS5_NATCH|nr:ATP-binding cassette domain-containing protein [Natrarchaeobius chitinivorans]RQH02455.1 ABC transporter ATP-binding protein [Natrarchaeobius chitinivorans]